MFGHFTLSARLPFQPHRNPFKLAFFTGSHVTKKAINLGGVRSQGQAGDILTQARLQRNEREEGRRREKAAVAIQNFCRGRQSAAGTRSLLRTEFDRLLSNSHDIPNSLLPASRLLALFFVDRNSSDIKRLAAWCRAVVSTEEGPNGSAPLLFSLFAKPNTKGSWKVLVRQISVILLYQASHHPTLPQAPLFLEVTKLLCDTQSYSKWKVSTQVEPGFVMEYLLKKGNYYEQLRLLLTSLPNKTSPSIPATVALTLLPFKAFPSPNPNRPFILSQFLLKTLTIPLLPHRVPIGSLKLLAGMPLEELLLQSSTKDFLLALDELSVEDSINFLSNIIAFAGKKIESFSVGKVLSSYLKLLHVVLDKLPKESFVEKKKVEEPTTLMGKEVETITIDSDSEEDEDEDDEDKDEDVVQRVRKNIGTSDGDVVMSSSTTPTATTSPVQPLSIDPQTSTYLSTLPSREHLISLLPLSTRFSATTRESLASFLVSLLYIWPSKRDTIINSIMYGQTSTTGAAGERGGGLIREIWRGYVRSSALGRSLNASNDRERNVIKALENPSLSSDWNCLILLIELYSKCLLTLGDDEFYDNQRNPLSLDEVVGLSSILRNLVFALYWQESLVIGGMGGEKEKFVVGTRLGMESLRGITTTILQQIHARDSRKPFTTENHWLMTSQFDLNSFIQTVVYEDEKLDDAEDAPAGRQDHHDDDDDEDNPTPARRRPIVHRAAALSKRQMAFISPRLGVLNNIPFVIPFETRVAIFRQFISNDRKRLGLDDMRMMRQNRRQKASIRRNNLAHDSFQQLNGIGSALKGRIEISFIDEHGLEEMGIDGGGLFKELLTSLSKEVFDTDRGLWLETKEHELYPNPHSYARESNQLSWYTFIGRILGKALYEGILVDVRFAAFFLAKWLGRQSYLDDLASLDPELYNGLVFLKNYTGNVEDLSLNFTVSDNDFGVSNTINLIPNGSEIPVTNENRIQYIYLTSHYRLNSQIEKQCAAFFSGLSEIIPERFLRMFNQAELRMLVGGAEEAIDVNDLKENTVYGGWDGDEANETIRNFWTVVEKFDKDERSKLVKFVTSCARPPLLGFGELYPKFAIRMAGKDETRLPTSSTCVNLLKLPEYSSQETLMQKLRYAINAGAHFDLS